ncbi:MAG: hypothetical protein MHPSP_003913, partial [Paramarteilia canceri]
MSHSNPLPENFEDSDQHSKRIPEKILDFESVNCFPVESKWFFENEPEIRVKDKVKYQTFRRLIKKCFGK